MHVPLTQGDGIESALNNENSYDRQPDESGSIFVEGDTEDSKSYEIEHILDRRMKHLKRGDKIEYLVRWQGYRQKYDRWYSEAQLNNTSELVKNYNDVIADQNKPVILEPMVTSAQPR
ncbi:hypothetical protein AJ79_10244 [Helicocarpus griseus UAMH5409]|uniref:Chromo domain-containing protein n=1 Tax=Helicocarpus griseus UAMH5409 TaxID=1447875 RepID=A0A2B7WEW9_9EURO|nr:hypothetical protein AJ79_10244 [Helicocarpus griseus UAMH5409]